SAATAAISPAASPDLPRQLAGAHQVGVDSLGALAALTDRPHDQRLAPAHIPAGEDVRRRGAVVRDVGLDVAARVQLDRRLFDEALVTRADEAHGEQHQVGLELELRTGDLLHAH